MRDEDFAVHSLRETLKLLALEPGQQRAVLPDYVVLPDELALTFDDAYQQIDVLQQRGLVTTEQREPIDAIQRHFRDADPGDDFWTLPAVTSDPRWQEVREQAADALKRLGVAPGWPVLDWISYAPGEGD